jgi:hypothetical protein
MQVTVRGWNRDMGETVIASHQLMDVEYTYDMTTAYCDKPVVYGPILQKMTVAWFQSLRLTGNYRMEIEFTRDDVMTLFKHHFGSQLKSSLVEEYGLTFSPELVKSMLKTVKVTDLTLGELVAMSASTPDQPATADKLVDSGNVRQFPRRV